MNGFISPGGMSAVRHIAFPRFLLRIPANHPLARIERFAFAIDRCAIVQNAPVHRPNPCPIRMEADFVRRVGHVAANRQVALLGEAAAIDPVARHRAAVVAQLREPGHLRARREALAVFVLDVGKKAAVQLTRDARRFGMFAVIPCEMADRLGKYAVLFVGAL